MLSTVEPRWPVVRTPGTGKYLQANNLRTFQKGKFSQRAYCSSQYTITKKYALDYKAKLNILG